jgi:phosphatidylserine decarboxylase
VNFAIHKEGIPFIALFAIVNVLAFLMAPPLGWLLSPLTIWCIAFFRDPDRQTPQEPGLIISPADGKLLPIVQAVPPPELGLGDAPRTRLSIFMNVFNVHVNRNPVAGTVMALAYRPGKFFNASFDKASIHNERMAIRVRPEGATGPDQDLVVVQIAGLVARRIVCELAQGQQVQRGARFGIIRFGSRLDVYLPPGAAVKIAPGSVTVAGETVLAEMGPERAGMA